MLEIGSLVGGKYKILNVVGHGGMSVVYLAMNEVANKQWAIKEIRKDGVLDFQAVKQGLVTETEILKRLSHARLPSIVDVIEDEQTFLIVMDYIEGNSLDKVLSEYGAQPQEEVIKWAQQLCDVLGYLHSREPAIIYRDMKPSNIMLEPDGNVKLYDFGIAREFKEHNLADTVSFGTYAYAAPEQFGGMGQTDARTDIFALGVTMHHLVTGRNPCDTPYDYKPIRQINPALSSGLEKIIIKCTQLNAEDRYQSAAELMYALEHYNEIDDQYRKREKKKLGAFLGAAGLTVVFGLASLWGYFSAENKKGQNYDYILANASSVEDYYSAILTDPVRTDAYLGTDDFNGLIRFLIGDGELSAEENSVLVKLKGGLDQTNTRGYTSTVDVLDQLKSADPDGYEQVCYEIGEAYLFYYDIGVEKDKYATAATWFQYAEGNYPVAKMYCDISACLQNIEKYTKAEQYAKLYEEYESLWEQVTALMSDAQNYDDDLKLRVWNEIVNMIRNNANEFCEVSTQEEIVAALDNISESSMGITNTFLQENIKSLQSNVETTVTKIRSVKMEDGEVQR